jgi:hypothetical protein
MDDPFMLTAAVRRFYALRRGCCPNCGEPLPGGNPTVCPLCDEPLERKTA